MNLTKIVGYSAPIFAAGLLVSLVWLTKDQLATPRTGNVVLGRKGEWVTRPDGRKVCRLSRDLTLYNTISPGFCVDWQEPEPAMAQPVEGWIRSTAGRYQIMIDGRWRP